MYIGCHISTAGKNGIIKAIETAINYNSTALQIFVSNRIGKGTKKISIDEQDKIKQLLGNSIKMIIHSPYTLNFAIEFNEDYWGFKLIMKELEIAHNINSIGCVIHMGKYLKMDIKDANKNFIKAIKYIVKLIKKAKLNSKLILETPAGQGTEMYTSVNEFTDLYNTLTKIEKKYVGICIDTCHIYSAGYDISEYFDIIKKKVGYSCISVIHLNDSKKEKGSCVDRHENIGKGTINIKDIIYSCKIGLENNIPIILETPDINKHKEEIHNLKLKFSKS